MVVIWFILSLHCVGGRADSSSTLVVGGAPLTGTKRVRAVPIDASEDVVFNGKDLEALGEELESLFELLDLGEETKTQLGETSLLRVLGAHIRDPENDPLFKNMQGKSWGDLVARAQKEYVEKRVEGRMHQDRLAEKLNGLFDALLEYVERYAVVEALLYPSPNPDEPYTVDVGRVDVYTSAYEELTALRTAYLEAHLDFWSDLTAVLKSQEDIPAGGFKVGNDVTSDLPAPFGSGEAGLVLLPVPPLLDWKKNDFGGVEDQIADLMALKLLVLPQIDAMRTGRGAGAALAKYTETLAQRFWRKGPKWAGRDKAAQSYVAAQNAEGNVVPKDPAATGIRVPGVEDVRKKGMEDKWLEEDDE